MMDERLMFRGENSAMLVSANDAPRREGVVE